MNKIKIITILLLILITLVGCSNKVEENDTIKIGGLFALTGGWAVGGTTEANFAKIAIDEINNEGGVNGKQIEFILEDDMCSGNAAVTAANKLLAQDIKIILGPSCTPASGPVAPITNENKIIILAATTTATGFFDNFEYAFRISPAATEAAKIIGEIAKEKYELNRIAMIVEQTEFTKSWADEFATSFKEKGGSIVLTESFPTGTTDFRTIITKIDSKNVDGVFVAGLAAQDSARILKQMKESGLLNKVKIMGPPTVIDTAVYEKSDKALPNDAFSVFPFAENEELLQKYITTYGEKPGFHFFHTAAMYDAAYIIKDAILTCEENTTCIKSYLVNNNWDGKVAKWDFDENGDPVLSNDVYKEVSIKNGEKVFSKI